MTENIIVRGKENSGKTTTCGMIFEALLKLSDYSIIYDYDENKIENLKCHNNVDGGLQDFIAIIRIKDFVILILSQGDVAEDLRNKLDRVEKGEWISQLTSGLFTMPDLKILCGRSRNKKGSAIRMLYDRIPKSKRVEFWTQRDEDINKKETVKKKCVEEIVKKIDEIIKDKR